MRKYRKIGIDIDNTMTNISTTLEAMGDFFGTHTPELIEITEYNLSSVFGFHKKVEIDFWNAMNERIIENSILEESRFDKMLGLFTDENTDIYIITSRDVKYYEQTINWLLGNGVFFKDIYFTSGKSKLEVIHNIGLEAIIDDNPDLFYEVQQHKYTRDITVLGQLHRICVDYPYNQNVPCEIRLNRDGEIM